MARLNFEDSIYKSPAFQKFMIRIGDRHKAMGMLVDLWALAQKHWFPDKRFIPIEEFNESDLSPILIECGLAEGRDGGVYAKGSEDAFQWLFDAQEKASAGGKKSAEVRKEKYGSAQPRKNIEQDSNHARSSGSNELNSFDERPNPPEPSFLFSLSSSLSSLSSDSNSDSFLEKEGEEAQETTKPVKRPLKAVAPEGTQDTIARYCDSWRARYGANPHIGKKVAGQIKSLVKDMGYQKAMQYIEAYLEMPDAWFVKKRHDIPTLMSNMNAVTQYIQTGRLFTNRDIRSLEQAVNTQNLLDMVERGQI